MEETLDVALYVLIASALAATLCGVIAALRTRKLRLKYRLRWARIERTRVQIEAAAGTYRDAGTIGVSFGGAPPNVRAVALWATIGAVATGPLAQLAALALGPAVPIMIPAAFAVWGLDQAGAALLSGARDAPKRARRA